MLRIVGKQLLTTQLWRPNARLVAVALSSDDGKAIKVRDDVHVVIVGGGLAGLSAAHHLQKNGFRNTVVLEATDRYGGRINTQQFGDAYCELGAKWIAMDVSCHSVYEQLLKQEDMSSSMERQMPVSEQVTYVNTTGKYVNDQIPRILDRLFQQLWRLDILLKRKLVAGELNELSNVHSYLQAEANKAVYSLFDLSEREIAYGIFAALCNEYSALLGCNLEYVNIEHIANPMLGTNASVCIPTGLDNMLHSLAAELDASRVRIGKPVAQIVWYSSGETKHSEDSKMVTCIDGSFFVADHVICTLPLGVLKTFSPYIFKPTLPLEKRDAIQRLGFGSPVKMYLEYSKDINKWFMLHNSNNSSNIRNIKGRQRIRPLWTDSERRRDLAWRKQIVEIGLVPTSKRVLEVIIGGAFHDHIEKLPDEEVSSEITKLLRNCLRNTRIPHPTSLLRSNWSSSASYLGGRPYLAVGSSTRDVNALAAPLGNDSLLFAGDATSVRGFGTIDGARSSGIREAQRIIDLYGHNSERKAPKGCH